MQNQIKSWCWVFLLVVVGWSNSQDVQANPSANTVCGVDVSYQSRCYRELKHLEQGCRKEPVICGQSFQSGKTPQLEAAKQRCLQLYRSQRRQWLESLCGVRLFSKPHTYCGVKGVEVAVACVQKALAAGQISPASRTGSLAKPVSTVPTLARRSGEPSRKTSSASAVSSVGVDQRNTTASTSSQPTESSQGSAVGQVKKVQPPSLDSSSTGSSFWLYALQFVTLGLVLLLLWRRQERSSLRPWEQRSRWSEVEENWVSPSDSENAAVARMETMLEQIELRLQVWEEQWREGQREHDPVVALQRMGDSIRGYYIQLAEVILEVQGRQPVSRVQRRLLESRDKMRWIFQAHRELPPLANAVERLQQELMLALQQILQQMGHVEGQQQIPEILSQGTFSVEEFLTRKAQDQAQRFLQNESLQSFSNIRNEYLQCVEQLYRSNLKGLLQPQEQEQTVAVLEQQQIFTNAYILGYLLQELPRQMVQYTRQSNRDRSGALVDQLLQFVDDELKTAGLEVFPVFEPSEFISSSARFLYLAHAGVRLLAQTDVILREAAPELLQARSQRDLPQVQESISVGESTAEYKSHAPEEATQGLVSVSVARPPLPIDNTAAYSQDLLADIDEVILAYSKQKEERNIANPDSDPPTAEVTTETRGYRVAVKEQLPAGPLPVFDATQGSQSPESPKVYHKITEEYGIGTHDSELPFPSSRHSSKEHP